LLYNLNKKKLKIMASISKKIIDDHAKFSRQMAAQWGVGDNGDKLGSEFKQQGEKKEKETRKGTVFVNVKKKTKKDQDLREKIDERFGEKEEEINKAVYDLAKDQLPEKIEDLYDKKVRKKSEKKETTTKTIGHNSGESESVIYNIVFQGIYQNLVGQWRRENGKKLDELKKEDVDRLRKEAWHDFSKKFPGEAKKYSGFEESVSEEKTEPEKEPVAKDGKGEKPKESGRNQEDIQKEKEEDKTKKDQKNENVEAEKTGKKEPGKENFDWQKRKEPEIIDAEFTEYKPPEITDQNWRGERGRQIEELKKELDQARKEYLEVDYKKNKAYRRLYKFLFMGKKEAALENDQDIAWHRAHYDNKLLQYRDALVKNAKIRGASEEELAEIVKLFMVEANINMADTHDQVKLEHHEGKFSETIKNNSKELVEKYRKMPLKQKMLIAAGFGIAGVGAAFSGSALLVGGAFTAATARRAFMSVVTGTGVAMWAESKTRSRREQKMEKENQDFKKQLEGLSQEEAMALVQEKIKNLIYDEDRKIDEIKNKNLRDLGLGIGAGVAAATAGIWGKKVLEGGSWVAEKTGFSGYFFGLTNKVAEHLGLKHAAPKNILPITVIKGSSFQGELIKNLESKGVSHKEAGKIAFKMWDEFQKSHPDPTGKGYNLIHPGAKINLEIGQDGKYHVASFKDSPPSEWEKHPGARSAGQKTGGHRVPKVESVSTGTITEPFDFNQANRDLAGMKAMEKEMLDIRVREGNFTDFDYGKSKMDLIHVNGQIEQYQDRLKFFGGNAEALDGKERDTARSLKEALDQLIRNKQSLEFKIHDWDRFVKIREIYQGNCNKVFNKIGKLVLFETNAHDPLDLKEMDAADYVTKHTGGNFGKFYRDILKIFGKKEIQPKKGEMMNLWIQRMTKMIVENRIVSKN
jgi:hypothetical protein